MIRYAHAVAGVLILLLAAVLAGLLYGKHEHKAGYKAAEVAQAAAAKDAYIEETKRHAAASAQLQDQIRELQNAKPKTITEYRDRIVKVPLPADCRIDDDRLRIIQAGIREANAAR